MAGEQGAGRRATRAAAAADRPQFINSHVIPRGMLTTGTRYLPRYLATHMYVSVLTLPHHSWQVAPPAVNRTCPLPMSNVQRRLAKLPGFNLLFQFDATESLPPQILLASTIALHLSDQSTRRLSHARRLPCCHKWLFYGSQDVSGLPFHLAS